MASEKFVMKMVVDSTKGVMARIATLLARKGYNISSMCVGKHVNDGEASIILTIHGSAMEVEQARKMLGKLINVISCDSYGKGEAVERELCIVKLRKSADMAQKLAAHNARILSEGAGFVIVEAVDSPERIEEFVKMAMEDIGVLDISRSGENAMPIKAVK